MGIDEESLGESVLSVQEVGCQRRISAVSIKPFRDVPRGCVTLGTLTLEQRVVRDESHLELSI